jgi:hypothetical protein
MRKGIAAITVASVALLFTPLASRASDFFSLTAVGTSSTVSASSSNVINLVSDIIKEQSKFAPLAGQAFTANLTYGGVKNAVVFTENAAQTQATLTIPVTGFTRTFNGTDASDLQKQIKDFLKKDGQNAYGQFLKSIDRKSRVASVDGNPMASTALIADAAFTHFGFAAFTQHQDTGVKLFGAALGVDAFGEESHTSSFDGDLAGIDIQALWRLGDRVAISASTNFDYHSVKGSASYTIDEELGVPIAIIPLPKTGTGGFGWQLTPWGFGGVSASYDQADGTVLVGGGGTSSLSYGLHDFTFTLADQLGYDGDVGVTIAGYKFDVPVNQYILKNGGQVLYRPNAGRLTIDGGLAYSNFLRDAAFDHYWTASAGVGYDLGKNVTLRAEGLTDFASHYSSVGGELSLLVNF